MNKTIVIFGSSTGTCESIAEKIASRLGCQALNVQDLTASIIADLKILRNADLSGKTIALFGCGDCSSYSDTFVGGIGELYNNIKDSGANFIGSVDTDGYSFDASDAVIDGKFIGLPLDEINEESLTDSRIDAWLAAVTPKL